MISGESNVKTIDLQIEYAGLPDFDPRQGWQGKSKYGLDHFELQGGQGTLSRWATMQEHDQRLDHLNGMLEFADDHPHHGIDVAPEYDAAARAAAKFLRNLKRLVPKPRELIQSVAEDAKTTREIVKGERMHQIMEMDLAIRAARNWVLLGDGFYEDVLPDGTTRAAQLRGLKLEFHEECKDPIGRPVLRGRNGKLAVWSGEAAVFLGASYEE